MGLGVSVDELLKKFVSALLLDGNLPLAVSLLAVGTCVLFYWWS